MLGGPVGAVLGAALGHGFDKGLVTVTDEVLEPGERERVQTAFFTTTFSVLGHIAKFDGRVSAREIGVAESIMDEMDLTPDMRRTAIRLYNEGKSPDFPLDEVLDQFRSECRRRQTLMQMFLEIQLQGAYADGRMQPVKEALLRHIAMQLGFPEAVFWRLERMVRAERGFADHAGDQERRSSPRSAGASLEDAYSVLNVPSGAEDADVKKAYRRLLNQHHPDKLVSKGLPEEMMRLAAQKTHEIKQAYETIKKARGMR